MIVKMTRYDFILPSAVKADFLDRLSSLEPRLEFVPQRAEVVVFLQLALKRLSLCERFGFGL